MAAAGRPGNNRPHNGGKGRQSRPNQNGHHAGHAQAPRQDAAAGEPSGIENVTFLKRSNEPRRAAGSRVQG